MAFIRRMKFVLGRAFRETGQAIDRIGLRALEKPIFREPFARHRPVGAIYEKHPAINPDVFVAPNATVVGDVSIGHASSVWYGAVVRGDLNTVAIGDFVTIGDRAVVHTAKSVEGHAAAAVTIGDHVTIGPGALLQSCLVENGANIGAGAIVMEGAVIEKDAIVADGAVIHGGRRVPAGQVWAGNPAVYVRDVTATELASKESHAEEGAAVAAVHAEQFLPFTTAYQQAEKLGVEDERIRAINAAQSAYEKAVKAEGIKNVQQLA